MIDHKELKRFFKNLISIFGSITLSLCFCITILHSIFLKYDYIKLESNQPPAFSLTREYYSYADAYNPELTDEKQYMYYGLGYNLIPKNDKQNKTSVNVESYFGFGLIDRYIVNRG